MELFAQLQAYLSANTQRKAQSVLQMPPFTLLVHGSDAYAVPDRSINEAESGAAWQHLRGVCQERELLLHVEFIEEFAPGLSQIAEQMGMRVNFEETWMVATPATLREPPALPGMTFVMLSSESDFEDVREGWNANTLGFDQQAALGSDAEIEDFRRSLITSRAFTARLDGQTVGSGMFGEIQGGVTQLIGISTLAAYRRRGIGASVTAYIARTAFASGVDVVHLIAASEEAQRIYERIGFSKQAHYRLYYDPVASENER